MLETTQTDGQPPPAEKADAGKPEDDKPVPFAGKKDHPCYYHGERKNQLVIYEGPARPAEAGKPALHRVRTPGDRGKVVLAEEQHLTTKPKV